MTQPPEEPATTAPQKPAGSTSYIAWNALFLALMALLLRILGGEAPDLHLRIGAAAVLIIWFVQLVRCAPSESDLALALRGAPRPRRAFSSDRAGLHILAWARRWFGLRAGRLGAFTPRLLHRAMLVAVLYPFLLLFIYWTVSGNDGRLGDLVLLPAESRAWVRYAAFGGIVIELAAMIYAFQALSKGRERGFWTGLAVAVAVAVAGAVAFAFAFAGAVAFAGAFAVAGAVAFAFAGAFAGAVAGAVAGAGAVAFAFAGAVAGAGAVAFAFAGAFAVAGAVAVAFAVAGAAFLDRLPPGKQLSGYAVFLSMVAMAVADATAFLPWHEIAPDERSLFVFLAVLPLINGVFDFLSYGITLSLLRRGRRSGAYALLFGILDLIAAAGLFLALGCTLIVVADLLNRLAGTTLLDLPVLLAEIGDVQRYWWAYAMVFSTMLPTLLHFVLALASMFAGPPPAMRRHMNDWIRSAAHLPWAMIMAPLGATLMVLGWLLLLAPLALVLLTPFHPPEAAESGWIRAAVDWYFGRFLAFADWWGVGASG